MGMSLTKVYGSLQHSNHMRAYLPVHQCFYHVIHFEKIVTVACRYGHNIFGLTVYNPTSTILICGLYGKLEIIVIFTHLESALSKTEEKIISRNAGSDHEIELL